MDTCYSKDTKQFRTETILLAAKTAHAVDGGSQRRN